MVTAPNDDWTEDLCIALIHEYRKRPILWDPKDPFFFKKAMKPEAWEGIGAALGMPAEVCKHKMVILQSSFRREKSKIMQSIKNSAEETKFTSSWFAFEEMAFLIDKDTERKRQSTGVEESCEDGPSAIKRSLLDHYNEKQKLSTETKKKQPKNSKIGTVLPNVCPKQSPSRGKIVEETAAIPKHSTDDAAPSITLAPSSKTLAPSSITLAPSSITLAPSSIPPLVPIPTRHKEETIEEIKSFTNFIAFKMKKYSETTKNCVQQAICDIIFKADQSFYETVHLVNSFDNYQATGDISEEVCDLNERTIDIGNGQTIKLQMHDSD